MHEATIAQSILNIASTTLEKAGCALRICVQIGELRNVENDSLGFAFDNLKELYTGFENCQLEMRSIKAEAWCRQTGHRYNPRFENAFCCDHCGSGIGQIICGEELDLVSVLTECNKNR